MHRIYNDWLWVSIKGQVLLRKIYQSSIYIISTAVLWDDWNSSVLWVTETETERGILFKRVIVWEIIVWRSRCFIFLHQRVGSFRSHCVSWTLLHDFELVFRCVICAWSRDCVKRQVSGLQKHRILRLASLEHIDWCRRCVWTGNMICFQWLCFNSKTILRLIWRFVQASVSSTIDWSRIGIGFWNSMNHLRMETFRKCLKLIAYSNFSFDDEWLAQAKKFFQISWSSKYLHLLVLESLTQLWF